MKIPINLTAANNTLRIFLWKYSLTVFLVPAVGAVAIAIFLIYHVVQSDSTPTASDTSNTITFDKTTMDQLKKLQPADSQTTYSLPTNQRSNPFTE